MSANTHTPGPWEVLDGNRVSVTLPCADVEASGYVSACIAITHSSEPRVDKVANARLIAAAPELLEALQAIVKSLSDQDDEGMVEHAQEMIDARAAIAKAMVGATP